MSFPSAFLGVENSLSGRYWQSRIDHDAPALEICQKLGVPDLVGRVLAGRGVEAEAAADFLNPTLRAFLRDPYVIQDMKKAALRIAAAIAQGESIAIFGDYDVDGATSSALLQRFFNHLGITPQIYIPDRISEGYGPNSKAFASLADAGTRLIITVDCGTSSFEPMAQMAERGVDVVVLDHHIAGEALPQAHALVNPNRHDDTSGYGQLAAVGVTFMLVVALNRVLREQAFYGPDCPEPDLRQWLDLVALGTVCDV
ncbi:MAG TPA: single-stranded-DNA-specific exonuclease RecJ, partial [Rhizobiales bacterium]|nr:single-stranded-DNA-specific exonuclease RecJ [Hyphomicrobiales bacterium]